MLGLVQFFPSSRLFSKIQSDLELRSVAPYAPKHLAYDTPLKTSAAPINTTYTHACPLCHVSVIAIEEECGVILKRWTAEALTTFSKRMRLLSGQTLLIAQLSDHHTAGI